MTTKTAKEYKNKQLTDYTKTNKQTKKMAQNQNQIHSTYFVRDVVY